MYFKDVTGDGRADIVSVSSTSSGGAGLSNAGSVFIIPSSTSMPNSGAISAIGKRFDGTAANQKLGVNIAFGDVDKDGKIDMLVGQASSYFKNIQ